MANKFQPLIHSRIRTSSLTALLRCALHAGIFLATIVSGGCLEPLSERRESAQSGWKTKRDGVLLELAQKSYDSGDLVQAKRQLEGILKAHPDDPGARILLARVHIESGRIDEAGKLLESFTSEPSPPADSFFVYGMILELSQQYASAGDHYRKAAEANPERLHYVAAAVEAYLAAGAKELAREVVAAAAPFQSPTPEWMCLKAEVCRSEGDLNAAVGHYESARLLDRELSTPRGAYIARELACLYRASSRHAEAARLLEELAKTTDSPGDRELLAWSLLAIGRLDRAAEVVATLNQEEADALTLWLQLAKRHAEHGRLDKAKITVKTALAIDPTDSDALLLDAYLSAQSGDTREAAQALRLLTDTRPDDPLLAPLQEFARRPNASTNR